MSPTRFVPHRRGWHWWSVLALAVLVAGASGCSSAVPTPTPTKTPKPLETPTATWTPLPPTSTPLPTATPIGAGLGTPTPEPVATPPAEPPTLPPDVCPLTGLPVEDPKVLERPPLAIKVSNAPAIVRPQSGLSLADVVVEHYAEANLTRLTAIYLSHDAEKVGPVRSGRQIDLEIPAMFQAIFACSGFSPGNIPLFQKSDFANRLIVRDPPWVHQAPFYVIPEAGKPQWHSLYTDTPGLWKWAADRGVSGRREVVGWAFAEEAPAGGEPAESITLVYAPGIADAEYRYDAARGLYVRFILGEPHVEALTGEPLTAANVVVLQANHVETDILEDQYDGGHYSIQIQLWGQGPGLVFRDGRAYPITWSRPERPDLVRFLDAAGRIFPLKPGNTWVQLVPLGHLVEYGRNP
ncbi:MAG: DUF3048 domain-containing protein [Anaerolineae bacterium]